MVNLHTFIHLLDLTRNSYKKCNYRSRSETRGPAVPMQQNRRAPSPRFDSCQGPVVALFHSCSCLGLINVYKFTLNNFPVQNPSTVI